MGKSMTTKALAELRGRQPWSEEQGRGVVEAWAASGESIPRSAGRGPRAHGAVMPSPSMADRITWGTDLVRPLWRLLVAQVLGAVVMQLDATSLSVRDKESPKGIGLGALWGYVGDATSVVYLDNSSGKKLGQREGEIGPEEFLTLRSGYVVADASNIFDKSFTSTTRIEVGCNMHARRYFVKALDANDVRAAVPIAHRQRAYREDPSGPCGDASSLPLRGLARGR